MNRNTHVVPVTDYNELLSLVIERDPAYWDRPNVLEAKGIALGILQIIESLDDNEADAVENFVMLGLQRYSRFQRL